jgi:hypothetical protein
MLRSLLSTVVVIGLVACGGSEEPAPSSTPVPLPAPEVYTWGGQPISFSAPPGGWRTEKEQSGGLRGARYVLFGSVGERIHVAEHYALDERDRCLQILELLEDYDQMSDHDFRNAIIRARPHAPEPINWSEAQYAEEAGESLDQAFQARMRKDAAEARSWLERALEEVARIHYGLDDVVDRVAFSAPEGPGAPAFEVGPLESTSVGGEQAYVLDYDMVLSGRSYAGREYYVLKNNRLFVASFQGLEENLDLFEDIVDSIAFPPGDCDHEG